MTLTCIPLNNVTEGATNMGTEYSLQASIEADAALQAGTEDYMDGIQSVAELNNKLIGAKQNLLDATIHNTKEVEVLKEHEIIGAKVFALSKSDTPGDTELYYIGTSNVLYKLMPGKTDVTYGVRQVVNNDALANKTPIFLQYYIDTDITSAGNYLVCITSDYSKYILYTSQIESGGLLNSTWTKVDFNSDITKIVASGLNTYYIDNEGKLYYFRTNNLRLGPRDFTYTDLNLDTRANKLYALTNHNSLGQGIFVFDLNSDNGSYNEDELEVQPTHSIFYFGDLPVVFSHMAVDNNNSYMNDDNNKIYLIGNNGNTTGLYSLVLKYDNAQTNNNRYNMSVPTKLVDIPSSADVNGIQIYNENSDILIYAPGVYYSYPIQGPNISLIQDTYDTINKSAVDAANSEIDDLKRHMINSQDTIQTISSNFDDNKASLIEKSAELNEMNDKLKNVLNEKGVMEGNLQEQSSQINMVVTRYMFWIVTSIITIILLALNYFAPDIITIEMIIVFAALMMIAVYLNRRYFGKYLDPIFSKLKTGFSSAISPLYSN